MLLVDCTVILSFWCILYSFFCLFQFLNSVFVMLWPSRRGLASLLSPCSHRLVCASFFSQLSHFSSRSSFCLHKRLNTRCNASRVSAVVRSASRLSLSKSCFCHSISLSVAGLSAANSPAPASPKEGERGLSSTDGERCVVGQRNALASYLQHVSLSLL